MSSLSFNMLCSILMSGLQLTPVSLLECFLPFHITGAIYLSSSSHILHTILWRISTNNFSPVWLLTSFFSHGGNQTIATLPNLVLFFCNCVPQHYQCILNSGHIFQTFFFMYFATWKIGTWNLLKVGFKSKKKMRKIFTLKTAEHYWDILKKT